MNSPLGRSIGYLVLALLLLGLMLWFVPFAVYGMINHVFGASIEHNFLNYFFYWAFRFLVFPFRVNAKA